MRKFITSVLLACTLSIVPVAIIGCSGGCSRSTLEPGGAYAPTNAAGQVIYSDKELALVDASYKFAYETALGVFKLEKDHRQAFWSISPDIKKGLDKARPVVVDIRLRWATARKAYKENPTPEGLTVMQSILSELNRLLPAIQSQISATNTAQPK